MITYDDHNMEQDPLNLYEKWFIKLDDWQKDLFNRLMEKELTDEELKGCFQGYVKGCPLNVDMPAIDFDSHGSSVKRLLELYNIQNVGAVQNENGLSFSEDQNLCLIFGDNGTGKSTFINLMKNMSGSRGAKDIISNVFDEPKPSSATITYVTDKKESFDWIPKNSCVDLKGLQYFDSEYYKIYESSNAEILLEPKLLKVLGDLAQSIKLFEEYINKEKEEVDKNIQIPKIYEETSTHKEFLSVVDQAALDSIQNQSKLNAEEESDLVAIQASLAASNPAEKIKELSSAVECLEKFSKNMKNWNESYSDEKRDELIELKEKCISLKHAIKLAEEEFKDAELIGTGNDAWKTLWKSAKEYSEKYAYPDNSFPNTSNDSLCVLCQQPLSDDAKKQFVSFQEYVTSDVENNHKIASAELIDSIPEPLLQWDMIRSDFIGNKVPDVFIAYFYNFYIRLFRRSEEMRGVNCCERMTSIFSLDQFDLLCNKIISSMKQELKTFNEILTKRLTVENRERSFSVRKWFSENNNVFENKKKILRLNEFNTNPQSISLFKTRISSVLITDQFIDQFEKELNKLGARNIKVDVKISTGGGTSSHKIVLRNAKKNAAFGSILSEGERRAVSFAAFVAELVLNFPEMPLVFDDPTNSMDRKYENEIANRIAELSKDRQVIVFTHRISMTSLLYSIMGKQKIYCQRLMSEPVGMTNKDLSFITSDVEFNTEQLIQRARNIKKAPPEYIQAEKESVVKNVRKLLEQMIEDTLFDGIVKRHNPDVKSSKLLKMIAVSDDDFQFVHDMMTEYSFDEHSQSFELFCQKFDSERIINDLSEIQKRLKDIKSNKKRYE